jgi:DNA polymerase (family 10)
MYVISNLEISRLFNLYAELLLLHGKGERLAALLNGASYCIRSYKVDVASLDKKQLAESFRPEVVKIIAELSATGNYRRPE